MGSLLKYNGIWVEIHNFRNPGQNGEPGNYPI